MFTATGLNNGETVGSVTLTASGGTAAADPIGFYSIIPSAATGGTFTPGNYTITYAPGQFEVKYSLYNFQLTGNNSNWVTGKVPIPNIYNLQVSNVGTTTVDYSSTISSLYVNIIRRGVCWGSTINPTINNNMQIDGANTSGNLTASLTGLISGRAYYIRTFLTVGTKTYYSRVTKFITQ